MARYQLGFNPNMNQITAPVKPTGTQPPRYFEYGQATTNSGTPPPLTIPQPPRPAARPPVRQAGPRIPQYTPRLRQRTGQTGQPPPPPTVIQASQVPGYVQPINTAPGGMSAKPASRPSVPTNMMTTNAAPAALRTQTQPSPTVPGVTSVPAGVSYAPPPPGFVPPIYTPPGGSPQPTSPGGTGMPPIPPPNAGVPSTPGPAPLPPGVDITTRPQTPSPSPSAPPQPPAPTPPAPSPQPPPPGTPGSPGSPGHPTPAPATSEYGLTPGEFNPGPPKPSIPGIQVDFSNPSSITSAMQYSLPYPEFFASEGPTQLRTGSGHGFMTPTEEQWSQMPLNMQAQVLYKHGMIDPNVYSMLDVLSANMGMVMANPSTINMLPGYGTNAFDTAMLTDFFANPTNYISTTPDPWIQSSIAMGGYGGTEGGNRTQAEVLMDAYRKTGNPAFLQAAQENQARADEAANLKKDPYYYAKY